MLDFHTIGVFLFLTVFLGGGAAVLTGRNFAGNWRPASSIVLAGLGIALGVRFLHFALFEETLLTLPGYLTDAVVVIGLGLLGYRWRRAQQMASQYYWLYERTGPLTWRPRAADSANPEGQHENG
jgi:hypothetical protein